MKKGLLTLLIIFNIIALSACGNTNVEIPDDKQEYEISFYPNNEEEIEVIVQEEGTFLNEPEVPIKEGYEFAGWFTDLAFSYEYNFSSHVLSDLNLYAKWIKVDYTLTVYGLDASVLEQHTFRAGDDLSDFQLPEAPHNDGYEFLGFDQVPSVMPEENVVINGQYEIDESLRYHETYGVKIHESMGDIVQVVEIEYQHLLIRDDNTIMRIDTFGNELWSQTFDLNPNGDTLIADMVVVNENQIKLYIALLDGNQTYVGYVQKVLDFDGKIRETLTQTDLESPMMIDPMILLENGQYIKTELFKDEGGLVKTRFVYLTADFLPIWGHEVDGQQSILDVVILENSDLELYLGRRDDIFVHISRVILTQDGYFVSESDERALQSEYATVAYEDKAYFFGGEFAWLYENGNLEQTWLRVVGDDFEGRHMIELPDDTFLLVGSTSVSPLSRYRTPTTFYINKDLNVVEYDTIADDEKGYYTYVYMNSTGDLYYFGTTKTMSGTFDENTDYNGSMFIVVEEYQEWIPQDYTMTFEGFDGVIIEQYTFEESSDIEDLDYPDAPDVYGQLFVEYDAEIPHVMPSEDFVIKAEYVELLPDKYEETYGVKVYPALDFIVSVIELEENTYLTLDYYGRMVLFDSYGNISWITEIEIPEALIVTSYEMVIVDEVIKVIGQIGMTACVDDFCSTTEEIWLPFIATVSTDGVVLDYTVKDSLHYHNEQFTRIFSLDNDTYLVYGLYGNSDWASRISLYDKNDTLLWEYESTQLLFPMAAELNDSNNLIVHCSTSSSSYEVLTFNSLGVLQNQEDHTFTYDGYLYPITQNILIEEDRILFYDSHFVVEFTETTTTVHDYSKYDSGILSLSQLLELPDGSYILIGSRDHLIITEGHLYMLHLHSDFTFNEVIEYDSQTFGYYTVGLVNSNGDLVLFGFTESTIGMFIENYDETGALFIEIIDTSID